MQNPGEKVLSNRVKTPLPAIDGIWLPDGVHQRILTPETPYQTECYISGHPCGEQEDGIRVRWPVLSEEQWQKLLALLQGNRLRVPRGAAFIDRLQVALEAVSRRFAVPSDPLRLQLLEAVPRFTGFSRPMVAFALEALDLVSLDQLPQAFALKPTSQAIHSWQPMDGLPGRLRFYPQSQWKSLLNRFNRRRSQPLFHPAGVTDYAIGFGAGNVPGTALLIAFLAQATVLSGAEPPIVFIRNSRQEPIFSACVLDAIQEVDADLFCNVAVLVWDYEDHQLQDWLLCQAGLVIAAASDETIAQIQSGIDREKMPSGKAAKPRFHAHGHKFSFSVIGKDVLQKGLADSLTGLPVIEIVAMLAALDSIFWDQYGCLSARNHFIEEDEYSAGDYAARLGEQLRLLASHLPRGAFPLQRLRDGFDKYKLLEATGLVQVFSRYEDEFLVILDRRPLNPESFLRALNDCLGRVIIVRPVSSLMEVPAQYLKLLPPANLQSLSVAVGQPAQSSTEDFFAFAEACGRRGVTAIRTVGRGAFPQLAYSWDGLIPLDLVSERLDGHFTTIEFNRPFDQILDTFHLFLERGTGGLGKPPEVF
jgi:hypothetical protein